MKIALHKISAHIYYHFHIYTGAIYIQDVFIYIQGLLDQPCILLFRKQCKRRGNGAHELVQNCVTSPHGAVR